MKLVNFCAGSKLELYFEQIIWKCAQKVNNYLNIRDITRNYESLAFYSIFKIEN